MERGIWNFGLFIIPMLHEIVLKMLFLRKFVNYGFKKKLIKIKVKSLKTKLFGTDLKVFPKGSI